MTVAMALTHIFGGRRASRPLISLILIVVVLALYGIFSSASAAGLAPQPGRLSSAVSQ